MGGGGRVHRRRHNRDRSRTAAIVRWNPGAARVYGYGCAEAMGPPSLPWRPRSAGNELHRILANVAAGERVQQYETTNLTREGHLINVALTMAPMLDERGEVSGISVIARDITEHVKLREELINLSLVDALTGLNNRRGFFHLANQQFKIARRTQNGVLLIFADVDNMKWINDSFGHQAGDRALVETADAFRRAFRESDIIGRIGGDEFAVLAVGAQPGRLRRDTGPAAASAGRAQRRRASSASSSRCSVGVVDCRPGEPISFDDMMAEADARMYEHKRSKTDPVAFPETALRIAGTHTPWNRTTASQTPVRPARPRAGARPAQADLGLHVLPSHRQLLLRRRSAGSCCCSSAACRTRPQRGRLRPRTMAVAGLLWPSRAWPSSPGAAPSWASATPCCAAVSLLLAAAFLWEVCRPVIALARQTGNNALPRQARVRSIAYAVYAILPVSFCGRRQAADRRRGLAVRLGLRALRHRPHHGRRGPARQRRKPLPRRLHRQREPEPAA